MTDTPKPPMVVTLNNMGTQVVHPREYYDKHIYVHLDQFMEEVERWARLKTWPHLDYDDDPTWEALQELDKEIKEGKV